MNHRHPSHRILVAVAVVLAAMLGSNVTAGASEHLTIMPGPSMAGPDGVVPEIRIESKTGAGDEDIDGLQDASGCNGAVCIWLTGSGLQLDNWETRGYPDSYWCSYARFWRNGQVIATSNTACGDSGTVFYSSYGSGWYPDGTQLCNTWTDLPGKPCQTVRDRR